MSATTPHRLADGTAVHAVEVDGHDLSPGDTVLLWTELQPTPHEVVKPQEPLTVIVLRDVDTGALVTKKPTAGPFWRVRS